MTEYRSATRFTLRTACTNEAHRANIQHLVKGWTRGATITYGEGLWTDNDGRNWAEPCAIIEIISFKVEEAFKLLPDQVHRIATYNTGGTRLGIAEECIASLATAINDANEQTCTLVERSETTATFI